MKLSCLLISVMITFTTLESAPGSFCKDPSVLSPLKGKNIPLKQQKIDLCSILCIILLEHESVVVWFNPDGIV